MRDIAVLLFLVTSMAVSFYRPSLGVLFLAVFAYLNPHRYAWGFSVTLPVFQASFLALVAGMIMHPEDRRPFPWTRETYLFAALLAWFTFTTFLSDPDYPSAAQYQWSKVMKVYLGIFPTFFLIRSRKHLLWLMMTIAVSFGLIGMKGGLWAIGTGFSNRVMGPRGTFYSGNNEIALALNMMLPLLLLSIKEVSNKFVKLFFWAMFVLCICSILSSWSRGGIVTLLATLGAIMFFTKKKWLVVSLPLLLLIFSLGPSFLPEKWFDRMDTIQTYEEDASVQGRFEAWRYAIGRAASSPLTGGGFETFRGQNHDAHNAYFEILGEHGYVALFIYINLLFGTMAALQLLHFRAMRVQGFTWVSDYARAIQLSLFAYSIGSLFLGTAYWEIQYHLIGLCVVLKLLFMEGLYSPDPHMKMQA